MTQADRYRAAAARKLARLKARGIIVPDAAAVAVLNAGLDRASTGDGAFVEVQVWIPASQLPPTTQATH
jgi:hypothetical protein